MGQRERERKRAQRERKGAAREREEEGTEREEGGSERERKGAEKDERESNGQRHVYLGQIIFHQNGYRIHFFGFIVQELCESRGGRPGLSVLTSLLVSVDLKIYCTVLRHWSQLVPNMSHDI